MKRKISGFTMIEMMAALVIAGILFAASGPAIRGIFTSNRMATHLNQLSTALSYARSEAIKRVTPIAVGTTSTWDTGWNVWVDNLTEDGFLDTSPAEAILRTSGATASSITLTGTVFNKTNVALKTVVYQPDGTIKIPDTLGKPTIIPPGIITFTLCYTGQKPRILTISTTGKPELTTGSTNCT